MIIDMLYVLPKCRKIHWPRISISMERFQPFQPLTGPMADDPARNQALPYLAAHAHDA